MSDREMTDVKDDLKNARDDASRLMSKEFEKLKDGFSELRKELKRMASNSGATGSTGVVALKDKAMDAVDSAKESVTNAKDSCVNAVEDLERKIANNPLTSVLVAVGVGYIYAKITRKG